MAAPFIPNRDSEFDNWLSNFSAKIAAAPAAYGLSAPDAAVISAAFNAWHTAFLVAAAPVTRTRPAIAAKDQARAAAVALVRKYAAQIRADGAVSAELKIGLGLRLRRGGLTRVGPPLEVPTLGFLGMAMGQHELVVLAEEATGSRAKPRGAAALLVLRTVGDSPATTPEGAGFLALATRTRFTSGFTNAEGGKIATYFARWSNSKGQLGPWGRPVSMRIAA